MSKRGDARPLGMSTLGIALLGGAAAWVRTQGLEGVVSLGPREITPGDALSWLCGLCGLLFCILPWISCESLTGRAVFFGLGTGLRGVYLVWRVGWTLAPLGFTFVCFFNYGLLLAEVALSLASCRGLYSLIRTGHRSAEADAHENWYGGEPPLVDVFIPTCNENRSILERALLGAKGQEYGRFRVWVLDDGRRPWVRELADDLGAHYLTRSDNTNAKPGNLNSGLRHVLALPEPPDYVAVLDADFVARPRFLRRAMSLMYAPDVGIVQTPQYHLNRDIFQHAFRAFGGWPDTQRFLFEATLPALDAVGKAFCCGTSFVARCTALQAIGSFPTESLSDDLLTGIKLGQMNWRTVYLREPLSAGFAPEGLQDYLIQRARWARGNAQVARWLYEQQKRSGTLLLKRLWTLEGSLRWGYTSLLRLLLLAVPLVYWYVWIPPCRATASSIVFFALPPMLLERVFLAWVGRGTQFPIVSDGAGLLSAHAVVQGTAQGFFERGRLRWATLKKGDTSHKTMVHWVTLRWFLAYLGLLAVGIAYHLHWGGGRDLAGGYGLINALWTAANVLTLWVAVKPCVETPRRRAEERYQTKEPARLRFGGSEYSAELIDLAVGGTRLTTPAPLAPGVSCEVNLNGMEGLDAVTRRNDGDGVFGLEFRSSVAQRRNLVARLFLTDRYLHPVCTGSVLSTFGALASSITRLPPACVRLVGERQRAASDRSRRPPPPP